MILSWELVVIIYMTMGQCNKMLEEMSFNALFQKLPVGIEVYDERGQLVDLNRTDENLFAISRKDIMGINLLRIPIFQRTRSLV